MSTQLNIKEENTLLKNALKEYADCKNWKNCYGLFGVWLSCKWIGIGQGPKLASQTLGTIINIKEDKNGRD